MKILRFHPASLIIGALAPLALLLSSAWSPLPQENADEEQEEPQESAPAEPGRYQIAVGYNADTVILLDTATGETWRWLDPSVTAGSDWEFRPMSGPIRE